MCRQWTVCAICAPSVCHLWTVWAICGLSVCHLWTVCAICGLSVCHLWTVCAICGPSVCHLWIVCAICGPSLCPLWTVCAIFGLVPVTPLQADRHSSLERKLLLFPLHPPNVKCSQSPVAELYHQRGNAARQGPTFTGAWQNADTTENRQHDHMTLQEASDWAHCLSLHTE